MSGDYAGEGGGGLQRSFIQAGVKKKVLVVRACSDSKALSPDKTVLCVIQTQRRI